MADVLLDTLAAIGLTAVMAIIVLAFCVFWDWSCCPQRTCRRKGHRWTPWKEKHYCRRGETKPDLIRWCERCNEIEERCSDA